MRNGRRVTEWVLPHPEGYFLMGAGSMILQTLTDQWGSKPPQLYPLETQTFRNSVTLKFCIEMQKELKFCVVQFS